MNKSKEDSSKIIQILNTVNLITQSELIQEYYKKGFRCSSKLYLNTLDMNQPIHIHLQYLTILNPLIEPTKKMTMTKYEIIKDIFNHIVKQLKIKDYKELQTSEIKTYFKLQNKEFDLQSYIKQLVFRHLNIEYNNCIDNHKYKNIKIKYDDLSIYSYNKIDKEEFKTSCVLYHFIDRDILIKIQKDMYSILLLYPKHQLKTIIYYYYYINNIEFFIEDDFYKNELEVIYKELLSHTLYYSSFKASRYFKYLSELFYKHEMLYNKLIIQSERWLQESMMIRFVSMFCRNITKEMKTIVDGFGSHLKCLLLQFITLLSEQFKTAYYTKQVKQNDMILYMNLGELETYLSKDDRVLCKNYTSPSIKIFEILDPKFVSKRAVLDNTIETRIGCDEHQISPQGLNEWNQDFKDNCPDVTFVNTTAFWCENCYLDYKQDCHINMCKNTDSEDLLNTKIKYIESCINKRILYGHQCKGEINQSHQQEINEKYKMLHKCKSIVSSKTKKSRS